MRRIVVGVWLGLASCSADRGETTTEDASTHDSGCSPGSPMCTCFGPEAICAAGWICVDNICLDAPETGTTADTDTESTTSPGGSGSSSSSGTTEAATTSAGAAGGLVCDQLVCLDCLQCSFDNDCAAEHGACAADDPNCAGPLACLEACYDGDLGNLASCSAGCGCGNDDTLLRALGDCAQIACAAAGCPDVPCSTPD